MSYLVRFWISKRMVARWRVEMRLTVVAIFNSKHGMVIELLASLFGFEDPRALNVIHRPTNSGFELIKRS